MKSVLISFVALMMVLPVEAANLREVKQKMIRASISSYYGNCPCPYNTMRNGRSCGRRSAYSKPGGQSPLCYEEDISDAEARKYLNRK